MVVTVIHGSVSWAALQASGDYVPCHIYGGRHHFQRLGWLVLTSPFEHKF